MDDKYKGGINHKGEKDNYYSYLEDLNDDMNTINEANKNLQDQLKRIGELESMLHIVSGERDALANRPSTE